MKRLFFEETERMSADGLALDHETGQALSGIFDTWVKKGYSIRDIGAIMKWAVSDLEVMAVLDRKDSK